MPKSLAEWLDYIERQHPRNIELGLDRVRDVATRMGLRRPARHVITVAGTNGKGSTVAFIEAIARAGGWRVGAYTSPHLLSYNERVRIDGRDADDAQLVEGFEQVEAARADTPLTYFEYGTLAALWLFQRSALDLAVLEVGLGGRLDAVNLVDADVAVVTTVDLDHQDWLGEDREAIGREKAGIARAGKPLVIGDDDPPASVLGHAYAIGAPAIRAGCDFFFAPLEGGRWQWREIGCELELPLPRLAVPAQMRNAACAIAAMRALDADLDDSAFALGVARAQLQGRLQRLSRDGVEIVIDVAHNPQAGRELAAWCAQAPASGRTIAVFAALGDKDAAGIADALAPVVDTWLLAGLEGPRGLAVDDFAGRLQPGVAANGERFTSVEAALQSTLGRARTGDRVLVFGSFHTAGAALRLLLAPV